MKLTLARDELATIAGAVLPNTVGIINHLPDSIAPPCVLVAWSDPWLKASTVCGYEAAIQYLIISQRIEPGGNTETLEDIVSLLVPAVKAAPYFQVQDVTSPYALQIGGVDYLAASINMTHDVEE